MPIAHGEFPHAKSRVDDYSGCSHSWKWYADHAACEKCDAKNIAYNENEKLFRGDRNIVLYALSSVKWGIRPSAAFFSQNYSETAQGSFHQALEIDPILSDYNNDQNVLNILRKKVTEVCSRFLFRAKNTDVALKMLSIQLRFALFEKIEELERDKLKLVEEEKNSQSMLSSNLQLDHYAFRLFCASGDAEAVRLSLKKPKINPSIQNNGAIRDAARRGHVEIVRILLADKRVNPLESRSNRSEHAVYMAILFNRVGVFELLIKDPRVSISGYLAGEMLRFDYVDLMRVLVKSQKISATLFFRFLCYAFSEKTTNDRSSLVNLFFTHKNAMRLVIENKLDNKINLVNILKPSEGQRALSLALSLFPQATKNQYPKKAKESSCLIC